MFANCWPSQGAQSAGRARKSVAMCCPAALEWGLVYRFHFEQISCWLILVLLAICRNGLLYTETFRTTCYLHHCHCLDNWEGGRPVLARNRRLPQWNRNPLWGAATHLCHFFCHKWSQECWTVGPFTFLLLRTLAFLAERWLHWWLQRSSTIWKSQWLRLIWVVWIDTEPITQVRWCP